MENIVISEMEKDALGEVMNISMGSAATAASELLNAKVWITTPRIEIDKLSSIHTEKLEPAVCVKIEYIKGISGSNLMVLRQDDVQLILNQLMGMPLVVTPDFEFDELNISAVSEVMNQMMGASATALSDFLGVSVDISTPTPYIMYKISLAELQDFDPEDKVCAINFNLTIDGVIQSEFKSVMDLELAKKIASKVLGDTMGSAEPEPAPAPAPQPVQQQPAPQPAAQPVQQPAPQQMPQQPMPQQPVQMPQPMPQMQQPMQQPMQMPMPDQNAYGYPPPYGYGYPPYGYPAPQPMNIQNAQLHSFEPQDINLSGSQKDNLQLLMDVPLQISVEIGSAKRKVKDILEFTQGTIIELERQAGAPVDIIVNGNLIAKGDVVVIDDNFAVRITEIIKSKLIDTLSKE
ncbi:MAG: flagellar motor switch phosphatase FliY [Ruminiclostridium sp.]|nr:flagellar motor switch phosphatase FliY [Ruminiclostridium sp.]